MSLFTAKDYQDFLETHLPQDGYLERVDKEAKEMVKLWIDAQGEMMLRQIWSRLSQSMEAKEDLHLPSPAELKAIFSAYVDCVNRTNAMFKRLTRKVKTV